MATSLPGFEWLWSLTSAPENKLLSESVKGAKFAEAYAVMF